MLFAAPAINNAEADVIDRIREIRTNLRFMLAEPKRWKGLLARLFLARSIQGSNSIEGFNFTVNDAVAAIAKEPPSDAESKDYQALAGYRDAMTYILHLSDDPDFSFHEGFVRGLHFMMLSYDPAQNPGKWRPGPIFVRRTETGEAIYEGPPKESIPELMRDLMTHLNKHTDVPIIVQAAMAHLNLAMIHPFSDGNGRMARALQTLVLVRERILDPEFCSIEEYTGWARQKYYDSLAAVGSKTWNPSGDARPFVRFCFVAHLFQAERMMRHATRMGQIWLEAEREIQKRRLPERLTFALADAAFLDKIRNASYRQSAGIDERRASKDLKLLVDQGLLIPAGERRGRSYKAGPLVEEIRKRVRAAYPPQPIPDPFEKK